MSTTIDTKVVEMRFDNRQFENNVSTTMSTLDKLKQKLNLDGASKGLENVSSAAGKVDMSSLSNGIENVRMKFSAMEVVGVTALANITNSAVNAGKNLVKSLSVDQIMSGWNKYGQKTSSVQTIMNATGKSIDEVNQYLDKLMWFSDETSYGFTDMTAALGQMTSAGGNIDKLIPLITGVANATAFAGKGASEFSRVMYNLNQSYGAGYLQYTDWRSIDLAGVSSKQLKETFIEVGEALGKIEKGSVTAANFATTLKDKWADTEVLEAAFGRFAEMSEKAYEMVQAGEVDTASEAYEILSKKYEGVAITAAKAAQEAKTFSEAIDATKDAVSSGWMKSFEIIFGDYEKAKVLWTDLANTLWDVFASGAEVRNWVLETALNFAEPWQSISEKLGNVTKAVDKITDSADKLKYFQDIVSRVWRGDFNNRGDNPDRFDLLTAAGYDYRVVQDLVNKGSQYKLTVEDIEASHKKFGLTMVTTTEETEDLTAAINNLSDEQLKEAGLTEDEIELYKALAKEAKRTGKSVSELADEMSKNDGRTMLIDSFKNFGSIILDTIQMIKDAFVEVFNVPNASEMVVKLYGMIKSLKEFSESIRLTNKETGELTETGQKFMSIFKGIFAAIDIVLTIIKGPAKLAFNVLKELLSFFGVNVLDILANVSEALIGFRDGVDNVVEVVTKFIVENVTQWIEKFKETKIFKTIAGWFKDASDNMSGAIDKISGKLDGLNTSGVASWFTKVYDFISGITKALSQNKIVTTVIDGICSAFGKLKSFFASFKLPEFNLDNVRTFLDRFILLGDNINASGKTGIAGVLSGFGTTFNSLFVTPKATKFVEGIESFFGDFVGFWLKIGDKIKQAFRVCQDALKAVVKFIFGTEEISLPVIMDAVEKFLWIMTLLKAIKLMDTIVSPFENITSALNNFANSLKWGAIGDAFKAMALALGVLTICIVIITQLDMTKAWQAAGMLAGLLIVMGGIIVGLGLLSSKIGGLDIGNIFGISVSLLLVVGAIALMVKTLKDIDDFKLKDPAKTFGYLAAILLALTVGIRMVAKAGGANFKSIAAILTLVGALKLILDVITAYDEFDWTGKSRAIFRMMAMLVAISVATNIASRGVKGGSSAKGLALLILAMVVSLKILLGVIEGFAAMSTETLLKGGAVVVVLLAIMSGMAYALSKANKGMKLEKGQKSVNNFTGLAVALLAVVAAIWLLGKMDINTLTQGGLAVAAVLILFTGLLFAIGKSCSGLKMGPIIAMIIGFAVLMAEMSLLMKWLDGVSWESKVSTAGALSGLLLAMAGVLRLLTKHNVKAKNIYKWLGALAALGLILGGLALILYSIKDMNPTSAIGSTIALGGLLAAMAGVLLMLTKHRNGAKSIYKWIGAMAVLGLVIGELAFILYSIKSMNPTSAIGNAIALGGLLAVMAGVMHILSGLDMRKLSTSKMTKLITALAGLSAVLALFGLVLAMMSALNVTDAIPNAIALSIMTIALSGVLYILSGVGKFAKDALLGVLALTTMAVPLAAFVGVLALMQNIQNAMDNTLVLTALATAMTLLLIPLTVIGAFGMTGAPYLGVLALLAMAVPLVAFVGVLALMQNVQNATNNAMVLTGLMTAMTLLLIPLTIIGAAGMTGAPYLGVLALLAMAIPMVAFVGVLALMNNIQNAEDNANLLISLMTTMTKILVVLALVGPLALIGVGAMTALTGLMLGIGSLAVAIGALVEKFPQLQTFLDTGIPILEQLAGGLGRIIGSFIAGFAGEVMTILPMFGVCLSQFMMNAMPFIMGAKMVDESVLSGVGILAGAVLALTAADLLTGIMTWLQGGSSFADLGTQLSQFMTNAMPFILGASMINEDMLSGVKALTETILILTAANVLEGLMSWLTGGSSLESFATQLPILGQGLASFSTNLGAFTEDQLNTVNCAADAIKTLAQASSEIPNTGGLLGQLVGENDLGVFAAQFPILGTGLAQFLANVGTFTEEQVATVNCAADAIKSLAKASSAIPNTGGLLGQLVGENDLSTFANQFPILGTGLRGFLDNVGTFTEEQVATVDCAAKAIKALASAASEIPNAGGWVGAIVGENDLSTFADQFPSLGTGLRGFLDNVGTFTEEQVATVNCAANAVKTLASVASTIPNEGGWISKIVGDNDLGTFAGNFPKLGEGLSGFVSKLGTFTDAQVTSVNAAVRAIKALSGLANADLKGATKHLSDFGDDLPDFGEDLGEFCSNMPSTESTSAAVNNLKKILDAVKSIASANSGPLATFADNLKKIGKDAVKKFVEAFTSDSAKTDLEKAAKALGDKVVDGLEAKEKAIKTAGEDAAKKAVDGAETQNDEMESAGKDLGSGLVKGINAKEQAAYDAGFALGQKAVQGEKDGQASESPSKLTIQAGKWLGEGLVIGMGKMCNKVYSAGHELGETSVNALSSTISRISDLVSSDIDTQPTIRPVMDLSDVESGVSTIGSMFGTNSIGVSANLGAISSMMNNRSQNGANADIVSAIDKLNKKMDNIQNASYTINGITYDDGSNINDAVATLVRAARIERRM